MKHSNEFCAYPGPPSTLFSVRGILVAIGLSSPKVLDENQTIDFFIECVKEMLIENDRKGGVKTDAVSIGFE